VRMDEVRHYSYGSEGGSRREGGGVTVPLRLCRPGPPSPVGGAPCTLDFSRPARAPVQLCFGQIGWSARAKSVAAGRGYE